MNVLRMYMEYMHQKMQDLALQIFRQQKNNIEKKNFPHSRKTFRKKISTS